MEDCFLVFVVMTAAVRNAPVPMAASAAMCEAVRFFISMFLLLYSINRVYSEIFQVTSPNRVNI
jgi:hypothetical protein